MTTTLPLCTRLFDGTLHSGSTVARSEPRCRLRSAAVGDLIIPRTTTVTSFVDRAFAHAGSRALNSAPLIRAAKTLPVFNKLLKDFVLSKVMYSQNNSFLKFLLLRILHQFSCFQIARTEMKHINRFCYFLVP